MKITFALALALVATATAYADSLVTVRPKGSDSIVWTQLGPDGTDIPDIFPFVTTGGVTGVGRIATGDGRVVVQSTSFAGNFSPGDYLIYTGGNGQISLYFNHLYTQVGAQIESNYYGPFTAKICAYQYYALDPQSCFTENGFTTGAKIGSPIYIGIQSSPSFSRVTFSLTSASLDPTEFVINSVTLNDGTAVTPEPSSVTLLGTGVLGALSMMRRRLIARSQ